MIKVIASDMDGTLLGDDHKIAPKLRLPLNVPVMRESVLWWLQDVISVEPWTH